MAEIHADLSQYYSMKAVFEQILGKASFMKVKDYGSLSSWKAETVRLLKTIEYSLTQPSKLLMKTEDRDSYRNSAWYHVRPVSV